MDPKDIFAFAAEATEVACCDLRKQDVPEVEAVIRLVTPRLDAHWQRTVDIAIAELLEILREIPDSLGAPDVDPLVRAEDRDAALEDLLLALLLSLEERLGAAPIPPRLRILREGSKRLLAQGSLLAGQDIDFGVPKVTSYPETATADALLGVRGRAIRRREQVRALLTAYLTSRAVRSPSVLLDDADPFEETLGTILGRGKATSVPDTVDSWAYRWFNVGAFAGAVQGGQTALVALNNPPSGPDAKTSPFCRWVHGKPVLVSKIERQLDEYTAAVREGDPEAQMRSWPFLSSAGANDPKVFRPYFAGAALPPYHHKCRTLVFPQVIAP
ncbi:MAG: hypothetical protein GY906_13050 [bacterium]|nr:hypothetical protein [bacterium]